MKIARTENVTLIFSGPEGKDLVMMIRFDAERTKKTLGYTLKDATQEDYEKLINNGEKEVTN